MRIDEIIGASRPSVSFEVFPPKRQAAANEEEARLALERTREIVGTLARERPSFISVTYGAAGGATGSATLEIARCVEGHGVPALAHLTCILSSRDRILAELETLREAGIENILCLRGDYPPDWSASVASPGDFAHAVDLVRAVRPFGFCLGGACYPERHPECDHLEDDIAHLKEKVEAGLDFLTTQMFFDNTVYFKYLSRLRSAGITIPVIAGIMPVTNGRQIARICKLSGTVLPPRFLSIVDRYGDDPPSMMDAGVAYATEQIVDLLANGVNAVHVYTMNRPETAARIMRNLGGIVHAGRS